MSDFITETERTELCGSLDSLAVAVSKVEERLSAQPDNRFMQQMAGQLSIATHNLQDVRTRLIAKELDELVEGDTSYRPALYAPIVPTPMPTIDHSSADRTSEREDPR